MSACVEVREQASQERRRSHRRHPHREGGRRRRAGAAARAAATCRRPVSGASGAAVAVSAKAADRQVGQGRERRSSPSPRRRSAPRPSPPAPQARPRPQADRRAHGEQRVGRADHRDRAGARGGRAPRSSSSSPACRARILVTTSRTPQHHAQLAPPQPPGARQRGRRLLTQEEANQLIDFESVVEQATAARRAGRRHLPGRDRQDRRQQGETSDRTSRARASSATCCRSSRAPRS